MGCLQNDIANEKIEFARNREWQFIIRMKYHDSSEESKKFASGGGGIFMFQLEEYEINYHTLQDCYGRYQLILFQSSLSLNSNVGSISIPSSEMNFKYGATKGTSSG